LLHHISFAVTDLQRSAAFYDATLATLGYVRVWANASAVGYGNSGGDDRFAIKLRAPQLTPPGPEFHLAFSAPFRDAVVRFHQAALGNGGRDNGAPDLRANYGENCFAAFVIDPDGDRIEAVNDAPA
jgi:catechol 2,3-dioxygenase-like lactoylglutathione lyase family enzyme